MNASSMRWSIALSAIASRPTSVRSFPLGTRAVSFPLAMLAAVVATPAKRPEAHVDEPPAHADRTKKNRPRHHDLDHDQPIKRGTHIVERQRHHAEATRR